jgi:hypothetical protein
MQVSRVKKTVIEGGERGIPAILAATGSVMHQNRMAAEVYRAASAAEGQRCTGMGGGSERDRTGAK